MKFGIDPKKKKRKKKMVRKIILIHELGNGKWSRADRKDAAKKRPYKLKSSLKKNYPKQRSEDCKLGVS